MEVAVRHRTGCEVEKCEHSKSVGMAYRDEMGDAVCVCVCVCV